MSDGLQVDAVTAAFDTTLALNQCSLEVAAGELLCLVGPSGCGKSTLLKVIAGFLEPVQGRIIIGGRDVRGVPVRDRHLAYIMDKLGLYPHLTVFENIAYPLRVRKLAAPDIAARVAEICDLTGIKGLEKRRPHELSAGQRQRVAIARALVRDDTVALLADESFSSLDAQLRYRLRTEFRGWQQARKLTCIFVTHDQEEALALGDRVALMNAGRIEQSGTAARIYDEPETLFAATFFGKPPCNIVAMTDADGNLTRVGQLFRAAHPRARLEQWQARDLMLGFRPEAVTVERRGGTRDEFVVSWIEPMNPDAVARLWDDQVPIAARGRELHKLRGGDKVSVQIDPAKWLLFDRSTGRRCVFHS